MGKLRSKQRSKITGEDRRRAAELIEEIRQENGDFDTLLEELKLDSESGRKVERVLSSLRQKANNSITLLSHDIYSESGRYIYELIQNADDCEFSIARNEGDIPMLVFHLTNSRLIVTSNEDGFSEANVRSICNMGNSSKTSGKHTGQKGIGFKSVFAAASKVHVRSDPYSFSFTPQQDGRDRGLSLVLPTNEESRELTNEQGTRFTLYPKLCEQRMSELDELRSLCPSIMLFLKKLRKIVIHIDTREVKEEISYFRHDNGVTRTITVTSTRKGDSPSVVHRYLIKCRHVRDLPVSINGPQASTGRVELAFHIESDGKPSTSPYQPRAYACLPVEDIDFKFDINADFHVTTDRERLQNTPRNKELRSEIAKAFCEQARDFAKASDLRFSWMVYYSFPVRSKPFWEELQKLITTQLQQIRLFWSRSEKGRFCAREVYHLPGYYCDDNGDPLFDDQPEQYLAKEYSDDFLAKLYRLGVQQLPLEMFLGHVAYNLDKENSYIRNYRNSKDDNKDSRHRKITQILLQGLQGNLATKQSKKAIKALKFIPLTNGHWISYGGNIFFDSSLLGSTAPEDVKLKIVRNSALPMNIWKPVFQSLGVSSVQPSHIVSEIEEMHKAYANSQAKITKNQIKDHLQYTFFNGTRNQMLNEDFYLLNHLGENCQRLNDTTHRFYFKQHVKDNVNELSSFELLESCKHPGVQFLHQDLADLIPHDKPNCHGMTWTEWLEANVKVRSAPVILVRNTEQQLQLSPEFVHIGNEYPEKIIRLLWQNWSSYRMELKELKPNYGKKERLIQKLIQGIQISTAGGLVCPISESYLPNQELLRLCRDLEIQGPLSSELRDLLCSTSINEGPMKLLVKHFGVRGEMDMDFCLKALMELKSSRDPAQIDQKTVKQIYAFLEKRCDEESQNLVSRNRLKKEFEDPGLVFYHDPESQAQQWLPRSKCLWDKDDGLFTGMISIRSQYTNFARLFRTHLDLNKPSLCMYVTTLQSRLGDQSEENTETIKQILVKISSVIDLSSKSDDDEASTSDDDEASTSDDDENSTSDDDENSTSDDDENSTSDDDENSTSDDENSESDIIATASMNSNDKSLESDHSSASANDSNKEIEIGLFDNEAAAFARLRQSDFKLFPLQYPHDKFRLASCRAAFVIPDFYELRDDFKRDVPILDLSLEQIIACSKLIESLGVGSKRLSRLGKYEVRVIDAHKDNAQTKIFRGKAAAFCGCLRHFTRKNDEELKKIDKRLSNVKILQCREVRKKFRLKFKSKLYEGKWRPTSFHIESREGSDHIFLPRDAEQRELGILAEFPQAMMELLEIEHPEARSVITMIVGASTDTGAEILMEKARIPLWHIQDPHNVPQEVDKQILEEQGWLSELSISDQTEDLPSPIETSISATSKMLRQLPTRDRAYEVNQRDHGYIAILQNIIREAQTIEFPRSGSVALSEGSEYPAAVRFQDIFKMKNWAIDKRHDKVGAAGELFVFKILERILPNFDLERWTSRIRHYVSVLEDFASIGEWKEQYETTDFQYKDRSGTLTELLLEMKYLRPGSVTREPNYLIEVKTGVGKCESRFYMSDGQHRLMKNNAMDESKETAQIYMLWRVFQVDHGRIGLRVFVDPWAARDENLDFKPSKWEVQVVGS